MVERIFKDIVKGQVSEAESQDYLLSLGWSRGDSWKTLLHSKRILIISEAGAGKTYECKEQTRLLREAGEPAFYLELASLAREGVRPQLDSEEECLLDSWLSSQLETATFFLDSIDELKLTMGSFERALKTLRKDLGGQLARARIVVTTRPTEFDVDLVRRMLPVPPPTSTESSEKSFADIAMGINKFEKLDPTTEKDWRTVGLMPFSDNQIVEFLQAQGIQDAGALLQHLQRKNIVSDARRPQDLIELCAGWSDFSQIRTHSEHVASNIRIKLLPRSDRHELVELSPEKAFEGASRIALAIQMMRRTTIRHSAASDDLLDEAAIDPVKILRDWDQKEIRTLLERPLFGFASYGRVRFLSISAAEYLAAQRILCLRKRGMPLASLKRFLSVRTNHMLVLRPSKKPVAAWLALEEAQVFELLRDNEPAVLLNEGDPGSLSAEQRSQALREYVGRYGKGGWRGLHTPAIQISRFASEGLASTMNQLWSEGIENPEVRETILRLIAAGSVSECKSIGLSVANDTEAPLVQRIFALDILMSLEASEIYSIAEDIAGGQGDWTQEVSSRAIVRMFPKYLSVEQLCRALSWLKVKPNRVHQLNWTLARLIEDVDLESGDLGLLRDGLVELASSGLRWESGWPHIRSDRPYLSSVLAATCVKGLRAGISEEWISASVLALRLNQGKEYPTDDAFKDLSSELASLDSQGAATLFWAEDSLVSKLRSFSDSWSRYMQLTNFDGPINLNLARDLPWVKSALADQTLSTQKREVLLYVADWLSPTQEGRSLFLTELKPLVKDKKELSALLAKKIKPKPQIKELKRMEARQAKRREQEERRKAKDHASWVLLWRELASDPEKALSSENMEGTAYNLWRVMKSERDDDSGRSGWNRRLLEKHFGEDTANQLRLAMMQLWRREAVTLPSERPESERNITFQNWYLYLAGIYAEAEDSDWAKNLTKEEAKLAARYALLELNGLPNWLASLVDSHPDAVDEVLGEELSWELSLTAGDQSHALLLQHISYEAPEIASLFVPRLLGWLEKNGDKKHNRENIDAAARRTRLVLDVLLAHGGAEIELYVKTLAISRLMSSTPNAIVFVWLSILLKIDPDTGVTELEKRFERVKPRKNSKAVKWFGTLLGDRQNSVDLRTNLYTPEVLLKLLHLAYKHVRVTDDQIHEGSYRPNIRDHAEHARNNILGALYSLEGEPGWAIKHQVADEPLFSHIKDRICAVAEEQWSKENDSSAYGYSDVFAFNEYGETPPNTNEAMFSILCDRLSDIDDYLLSDSSPREMWAKNPEEKLIRREVARVLKELANDQYKVDQEAVTADEKETDIRLLSTSSEHQAVIELKVADDRTLEDLKNTIQDQLVKKYMAAETRRSGCLLVALSRERKWKDSNTNKMIGVQELMSVLSEEARRVQDSMGGAIFVISHLLDLRARLPKEKKTTKTIKSQSS